MRGILVNSQGEIVTPIFGVINVEGKTITEAQNEIKNKVEETLTDPDVVISLDQPRPFTIHITGDIPHPGKYVIPAQSRVDFAIFQSVTDGNRVLDSRAQYSASSLLSRGYSFRDIKITHKNGETQSADLISYYSAGSLANNPFVRDGDLITLTKSNPDNARISVSGSVRSPFEVEFLETDTPEKLLKIAGGFTPEADTSVLMVLRRVNNQIVKIELNPTEWSNYDLLPNDRLIISSRDKINRSASAWVNGEINFPGNFPIINGTTTAYELLEMAGDFTSNALPKAGYLIRAGSVENEVPNKFNSDIMKRTSNQLLQGFEYLELENRLSRNRVFVDLSSDSQLKQVRLFDGDRLFVPRDENTVFVFGQVNNPGYFPYDNNNALVTNYISKAGGFSLAADKDRIFIIKAGSNTWYKPEDTSIDSGDLIFVDRNPFDELNAKRNYEIQKQQLKNNRIQLVMTALTTITSIITAYVAITRN